MHGIITDIQRFSIHDGPGIRTTVFLKGCNLRCFWCHNPETLKPGPEMQDIPTKCIGCGACLAVCPHRARLFEEGQRVYLRERCAACGACAEVCYAEATVRVGREVTVEEVVAEVLRDRPFYEHSGGGVTLSGGEPLYQPEFARAVLAACKSEDLHTAIETNLAWPWGRVAAVLPVTDLVMLDVKTLDDARHRAWTGAPNAPVLANVRRLAETGVPFIVRTPVIPGCNDTADEIRAITAFLSDLPNLLYYELLPFHPLATGKYAGLGLDYRAAGLKRPPKEQMRALAASAREAGLPVRTPDEGSH